MEFTASVESQTLSISFRDFRFHFWALSLLGRLCDHFTFNLKMLWHLVLTLTLLSKTRYNFFNKYSVQSPY